MPNPLKLMMGVAGAAGATYETWMWGGDPGGLGGRLTNNINVSSPVLVAGDIAWNPDATMNGFTNWDGPTQGGVDTGGRLWWWGIGNDGSQGGGVSYIPGGVSSPVQIGALTTWAHSSHDTGGGHAIKSDGTLWGWGGNDAGQLGTSNVINRSSPVQIGARTDWAFVHRGRAANHGVTTAGKMYVWGNNFRGRLGLGHVLNVSSPTQLGAGTNWLGGFSTEQNVGLITTDGKIYAVGSNNGGTAGQNSTTVAEYSSPVQIGALTTWTSLAVGHHCMCAVKTDGTIWAWGTVSYGKIGIGIAGGADVSSPTQIGALTTWVKVVSNLTAFLALKSDGTIWAWGKGGEGQLGQITSVRNESSPVQVGNLATWTHIIETGGRQARAMKPA